MTLSRFLKDYIYIPLGGSRKSSVRVYTNLLITFILGGIWHGAGWTFIFWGFLHGLALAIHRLWKKLGFTMSVILAWFITFNFINVAWVFFRAKEWNDAIKILSGMIDVSSAFSSHGTMHIEQYKHPILDYIPINTLYATFTLLIIGFIAVLLFKNVHQLRTRFESQKSISVLIAISIGLVFGLSLLIISISTKSEFLYFNF